MSGVRQLRFGILVVGLALQGVAVAGVERSSEPLRVATFNIRYGSAPDGEDRWELRRSRVVETIRELDLDVVGLQEAEAFQTREILAALPRYAAIGVSRDDGRLKGEACPLLVDRTRFVIAESGVFWLSDRPEEPGSITWDNVCTRVCTWARLIDWETGRGGYVYNVHLDHVGQQSRERAAVQVRADFAKRAARAGAADPLIVMGDFNAAEDNPAIATIRGTSDDPLTLRDAFRVLHADGAGGTFNGFKLDSEGGDRKIDYVWVGPGWQVVQTGIDRRKIDGRYPSDHFPVWAELRWP